MSRRRPVRPAAPPARIRPAKPPNRIVLWLSHIKSWLRRIELWLGLISIASVILAVFFAWISLIVASGGALMLMGGLSAVSLVTLALYRWVRGHE